MTSQPLDYFTNFSEHYFSEVGYYLLCATLNNVLHTSILWFFLIVALIAIPLKIAAIWRLTEFQLLSILIYFSHFFILHDMTQVRQGIASGILLFSLPEIEKKNFLKFALLLCFGVLFHYSALLFFPFYFLNTRKLNKPLFFAILIVPQILYLLRLNIISILAMLNLGIISEKLNNYNELLQYGLFTEINVYNAVVIIQLIFCSFLIWKSDFLQTKNKYAILLIKIYTIGIGCWMLFYTVPVIAFRTSGFFEVVEIILVPFVLYYIEEKGIAIALIVLFGFALLYIDVIHSALMKPYAITNLFAYTRQQADNAVSTNVNTEDDVCISIKQQRGWKIQKFIIAKPEIS